MKEFLLFLLIMELNWRYIELRNKFFFKENNKFEEEVERKGKFLVGFSWEVGGLKRGSFLGFF